MSPIAGAIAGAAIGGVGGIIGSAISAASAKNQQERDQAFNLAAAAQQQEWTKQNMTMQFGMNRSLLSQQNAFNSAESLAQRNWAQEMDNSRYQRTRADMEKAGLNPYAMYAGGQGAGSVPSGSSASSASQSVGSHPGAKVDTNYYRKTEGIQRAIQNVVQNALNSAAEVRQWKMAKQQIEESKSRANLNNADAVKKASENEKIRQEFEIIKAQLGDMPKKGTKEYDKWYHKVYRALNKTSVLINPTKAAIEGLWKTFFK